MKIVRPVKVKIPGPIFNKKKLLRTLGGRVHMQTLPMLRKAKTFFTLRAKGVPSMQAKAMAGMSSHTNLKTILDSPIAQVALEQVLREQKEFSDSGITERLKEMWNSVVVKKEWDETNKRWMRYKEPDKDLWKYSMDRVLDLRGFRHNKKDDEEGNNQIPTQIVFNVLNTPEVKITPHADKPS